MGNSAIRMVFLAVAATGLYFGLAVLGEGGLTPFLRHPALVGLFVVSVLLAGVGVFSGISFSAGVREDRGNRWVIWAFGVLGMLGAFLPAFTDRCDFWTVGGETIRWIGLAVFTAGSVLRIGGAFVLGRRFSPLVAIQPGHTLVTGGLYGTIRHPSYLGLVIASVGMSLVFRSMVGLIISALLLGVVLFRIAAEERLLQAQFGDAYAAYRRRTARLIPRVY